jgi:hypothetical protein
VGTWKPLAGTLTAGILVAGSLLAPQGLAGTTASLDADLKEDRHPSRTKMVQAAPTEFTVSDVVGQSGQTIALGIKPQNMGSPEDLFAITGLPPEVKLSSGSPQDDIWLVRRKELTSLAILAPEAFSRRFQIAVTRVRTNEKPPLTLTASVTISAKPAGSGVFTSAGQPRPRAAYERSAGENALFDKARERFKTGDIAGARAIFEVLALKGDPDAAIAIGETYDPIVLGQLYVKGLQPDEAKAVAWYRKADELGDQRARTRLNALNQN